jgi:hypothetical protein
MTVTKNVNGKFYPRFHAGWGGFADELFHSDSRYDLATEASLSSLSHRRHFTMSGDKAAMRSEVQRELMPAILSTRPDHRSASVAAHAMAARQKGLPQAPPRPPALVIGRYPGQRC